ncbi:acylhydrolase [Flavobacterium sp. NST-5]|uniref:Acylhydrolase n=1 Tax=Flavobacterium ichthyis TaxID=2698827 RepID=A0ABW9ZD93_9FLAO|nr:SGNH/GDSL hydrolase family protein [Flavobacterium ichthyis]NBL66050.1 acylhydrolase [Flavobacterium ichthyis]
MRYLLLILLLYASNFYGQEMKNDWANFSKYKSENISLKNPTENRVVFMGNSITEGWKTADPNFFSENNYINRGISGQVSAQMLARFRQDVIYLKPDKVVILAGTNDIAQNNGDIAIENIFDNIVSMVELAAIHNITPIICSILPALDFPWNPGLNPSQKIIELNMLLENYALKNNFIFVDYHSNLKNSQNGLPSEYSTDGVHLNKKGYQVMKKILFEALN